MSNELFRFSSLYEAPAYTWWHIEQAMRDDLKRQWEKLIAEVKAGKHPHIYRPHLTS